MSLRAGSEVPEQNTFGEETPLPQVPLAVPNVEDISPIASAFSHTTPLSNKDALRLLADFQKSRKPHASQRQKAKGQEAITALNAGMFRLVLTISREQVSRRYGAQKVAEMTPDLVQEGAVAIAEAAARFDVTSGGQWSAYAGRAVRDRIRSVVTKDEAASTPPSWKRVRRIASTRIPELKEELGRPPTMEELHNDLLDRCLVWADGKLTPEERALPPDQQHQVKLARLRKQGTLSALKRLSDVLVSGMQSTSMQAPSGENRTVGDTIANTAAEEARWDAAELSDVRSRIKSALAELDERSRTVIVYRMGFVDGEAWTHVALAKKLSVSSERVRQIEQEALLKLKAVSGNVGLIGLL